MDQKFNTSRLIDILHRRELYDGRFLESLLTETVYSIDYFEPHDFILLSKSLSSIPADVVTARGNVLANEVAEWSLKRWKEFSRKDFEKVKKYLSTADHFKCNDWGMNELKKWSELKH